MKPATARKPAAPRARPAADALGLVAEAGEGRFPTSLYVEGPDEALKTALILELRRAWARYCPEAPMARVFDAGEDGVDEILGAYHSVSMFSPKELILVFGAEDLTRSEKRIAAMAEGVARPAGESCLILAEKAGDSERKTLAPIRAACAARVVTEPVGAAELARWAAQRLATERVTAGRGAVARLTEVCEGDSLAFFNELAKLITLAGPDGQFGVEEVETLTRPIVGADVPEYLAAVAAGETALAVRRLSRALAEGTTEGALMFALANLVGGALGGWAKWSALSGMLQARRRDLRELAEALDAVYRAEAAWKGGRADPAMALEMATREVAGAGRVRAGA